MAEEKKGRLLRETMEWRMLPASMYGQEPAAPSLVYGAQHLLRLFGERSSFVFFFYTREGYTDLDLPPMCKKSC